MFCSEFGWDKRSLSQRLTLVPELVAVLDEALRLSSVPFQLVQGARTIAQQREYFLAGKSKVNPDAIPSADLYAKAKHVTGPGAPLARAVDIICATPGKTYDAQHLTHIAGVVLTVARIRGINIRWGGNWDKDHEILTDQAFDDLPHFEIE